MAIKRKLITLSTVSLLLGISTPVFAQNLDYGPDGKEKTPGAPPELPTHPEHIEKSRNEVELPEPLKQHREHFEKAKGTESKEPEGDKLPAEEKTLLQDEKISEQWRKYINQGDEAIADGKFSSATSKYKKALSIAEKSEHPERLSAITLKRLGMGYTGRKQFTEARDYLKEAADKYRKLGINDEGMKNAVADLQKWYKELDFRKFGDKVAGYFKEAKVERISVFKDQETPKIEVSLQEKLIRDLKSEKVKKIRFDKTISFNFKILPQSKYGVDHVEGLQVKTKKLWVNLFASIMGLNPSNEPEASVTGGKLGKEKTVTLRVPDKVYDKSIAILNELKEAINSTKYDSNLFALTAEGEARGTAPSTVTIPGTIPMVPVQKSTIPGAKNKPLHPPPEVIHTIEKPVEPENLDSTQPYGEVMDSHLNQDKPTTRYP